MPDRLDIIRRLFVAYKTKDDSAFMNAAQAIIRELTTANRHAEAKALKKLLEENQESQPLSDTLRGLPAARRPGDELVTRLQYRVRRDEVFLSFETATAIDRVLVEFRERHLLTEHGLHPKTKLLFWGPPGCGKTYTAQMVATELELPLNVVRLSNIISSYVGETASNLQRVFSLAASTPMVLLLDEADALAKDREDKNDVGELKRVVNSLLQMMDDASRGASLIIMASNHQYLLDPAIWRRFDDVIQFPMPTAVDRERFLKYLTNGLSISGSLPELSRELTDFSFADLDRIVNESAKDKILHHMKEVSTSLIKTNAGALKTKRKAARSGR